MSPSFQREYLVRLPLPLAQLYSRAHNDKTARSRHDCAYYLFEALVKLTAAPAAMVYVAEARAGVRPRVARIDELLAKLQRPSQGDWLALLRELARDLARRPDAATLPLGHLWGQLSTERDSPGLLGLYRRLKNGVDGVPAGDSSCALLDLFTVLVRYRNDVFGHGSARPETFYERDLGPLFFAAAGEILAEGVLDILGPRGSQLVAITELGRKDAGQFEALLYDLSGVEPERQPPRPIPATEADAWAPGSLAVLWPGRALPVRLAPLLVFHEPPDGRVKVFFLNGDKKGAVQYVAYDSGETRRDPAAVVDLAQLVGEASGRSIDPARLRPPPVADYEIEEEIGRGGMGIVYKARHRSLGMTVALKMLPPERARDELSASRFHREMRALARCNHPNIIKVIGGGSFPDGREYYAMEYVPGCTLEDVFQRLQGDRSAGETGPITDVTWDRATTEAAAPRPPAPPASPRPNEEKTDLKIVDPSYVRRVAALLRDAALALEEVHRKEIVHRDIKPANLMLGREDGRVVLMDFGLAKGPAIVSSVMTRDVPGGTLRYMAPEQLAATGNQGVGYPADVRALGVTLWELLTRRRVFAAADNEEQLRTMIRTQDVPLLRTIDRGFDADIEAIVARATEREPARRIPSAAKLAEYLTLYLEDRPLPIRTPSAAERASRWLRTHRAFVVAATLTAASLAVALGMAWRVFGPRPPILPVDGLTVAPNEAEVRLVRQGVQLLEQDEPTAALPWLAEALNQPNIDPKREEIQRLRLGAILNRCPRPVQVWQLTSPITCIDFSVDGTLLLAGCEDGTARVYDVVTCQALFDPPLKHERAIRHAAFSPDGRLVVTASADRMARLWDARTGKPASEPLKHDMPLQHAAFSPDGKRLATACGRGQLAIPVATTQYQQVKEKVKVLRDGREVEEEVIRVVPVTQTTEHWISSDPDVPRSPGEARTGGAVRLWDVASGRPLTEPLRHPSLVSQALFTPDGTKVVSAMGRGEAFQPLAVSTGSLAGPERFPDEPPPEKGGEEPDRESVRLWDATTGRRLPLKLGLTDPTRRASFSPDGHLQIAAGPAARLVDLRVGKVLLEAQGTGMDLVDLFFRARPALPNLAGVFVPDRPIPAPGAGGVIVPARPGGWLLEAIFVRGNGLTSQPLLPPLPARERPAPAAFPAPPDPLFRIAEDARPIHMAQPSPDGRLVLTAGRDLPVRFWDLDWGTSSLVALDPGAVRRAAFGPEGRHLALATAGHRLSLWDLAIGEPQRDQLQPANGPPLLRGHLSPDLRHVAGAHVTGHGHVLTLDEKAPTRLPLSPQQRLAGLAFCPDGRRLLAAVTPFPAPGEAGKPAPTGPQGELLLWDVAQKKIMRRWKAPDDVAGVTFGEDGRHAVTIHFGPAPAVVGPGQGAATPTLKTVRAWNVESGTIVGPPISHDSELMAGALSPSGAVLATAHADGVARLWDVATGQLRSERKHGGRLLCVAFSPDGRRVATGSDDRTARLGDAETGRWLSDDGRLAHTQPVAHVLFSRDGRYLVTVATPPSAEANAFLPVPPQATGDGEVRVWDGTTGRAVSRLMNHRGPITAACLSEDGRYLLTVTGTTAGAVPAAGARVWETATGDPISPILPCPATIAAGLSADDRGSLRVVVLTQTGQVLRWALSPERRPVAALGALATLLSGRQIDATGSAFPAGVEALQAAWALHVAQTPAPQRGATAAEVEAWRAGRRAPPDGPSPQLPRPMGPAVPPSKEPGKPPPSPTGD